jgi:pilus assembly protein Flp/PilA
MNNAMNSLYSFFQSMMKEEEGAQVIEYALIIAVVAIALVVALRGLTGSNFSGFIARVNNCLTGTTNASCA